ncbi:MAG: SpoIIIAH-like family protein [Oscillospiraceae bacterium]|nr:SpoIIIAH-like family protein [Oscillospiraceae bacterium]
MNKAMNKIKRLRVNMIIGKKQIIIAGLCLLLGLAVFANYSVTTNRSIKPAETESGGAGENQEGTENSAEADRGVNYGDAQFVSGGEINDDDVSAFFAQARLSKRESRDEAKEFLQTIISGGDVRSEEIQAIAYEAATLGDFIESEARVEAVLKAQGFSDVLCYISDKGTNIIVRTDGLTAQCAAKIKDALLSEVDVLAENITIVEIN